MITDGLALEQKYSRELHQREFPVLVSSLTLRAYSVGQIDICTMRKYRQHCGNETILKVYEVKSRGQLGFKQKIRLMNAAQFLGDILNVTSLLFLLNPKGTIKLIR